jgi:hypothetical protein
MVVVGSPPRILRERQVNSKGYVSCPNRLCDRCPASNGKKHDLMAPDRVDVWSRVMSRIGVAYACQPGATRPSSSLARFSSPESFTSVSTRARVGTRDASAGRIASRSCSRRTSTGFAKCLPPYFSRWFRAYSGKLIRMFVTRASTLCTTGSSSKSS